MDYYTNPFLQTILLKMWTNILRSESSSLHPVIYRNFIDIISKAMGDYLGKEYNPTRISNVTYDRYCFDVISLFGSKLFDLSLDDIEKVLRAIYREITFVKKGKVYLK